MNTTTSQYKNPYHALRSYDYTQVYILFVHTLVTSEQIKLLPISVVKCLNGLFQSYCENISWKCFCNHVKGCNSLSKILVLLLFKAFLALAGRIHKSITPISMIKEASFYTVFFPNSGLLFARENCNNTPDIPEHQIL